jgi:hypothetical protein
VETIKVRVENGKIIEDAPPGVPDGTELEIRLADPRDDLTDRHVKSFQILARGHDLPRPLGQGS